MISALRTGSLAAALLLAVPTYAQTPQDHETHQPTGEVGSPPAAAAPEAPPGQMSGQSSRMGQCMIGPDMMHGGMMGGRGMMSMMNMMAMMGARHGVGHIEGRLAFIKTELKITDAQLPQWNAFAEAVRENAKSMSEMHQSMGAQQNTPKTLPERLAFEDKALTAHLGALKKTEGALDKLYAALSPEQKEIADQIIVGPMGMPMGMM